MMRDDNDNSDGDERNDRSSCSHYNSRDGIVVIVRIVVMLIDSVGKYAHIGWWYRWQDNGVDDNDYGDNGNDDDSLFNLHEWWGCIIYI